jgi:Tfp pilus assembly protein FimV
MAAIFEVQTPTTTATTGVPVPVSLRGGVRRGGVVPPPSRVRLASAPSAARAARRRAPSSRRRVVAALVASLAIVAMCLLGWSLLGGTSSVPAGVEASGDFHVVSEGDTLYSVAEAWAPAAPVASTIERIEQLNGAPLTLVPGDVIALPLPLQ